MPRSIQLNTQPDAVIRSLVADQSAGGGLQAFAIYHPETKSMSRTGNGALAEGPSGQWKALVGTGIVDDYRLWLSADNQKFPIGDFNHPTIKPRELCQAEQSIESHLHHV